MKTALKSLSAAAVAAALMAMPAHAQMKNFSLGLNAGYYRSGNLAENSVTGTELRLDNGAAYGADLEGWLGSSKRWGFRVEGNWTRHPYALYNDNNFNTENTDLSQFGNIKSWMVDGDLMLRLLTPTRDRMFSPFIDVGGGFVTWNPPSNDVGISANIPEANAYLYGDRQWQSAVTAGIGTDWFLTPGVALRLEAKDYWNPNSPYLVLDNQSEKQVGGHNLLFRAGLNFYFGGGNVKEPGFVAAAPTPPPAPAPAPAPEPEPAPAPEPTTEAVSMCVIGQNYQPMTVAAVRQLDNGTIYVDRNGSQVAFNTAYPATSPVYVRGADWYTMDQPLVVDLTTEQPNEALEDIAENPVNPANYKANRFEFVRFGTASRMPASDLTFVGTVNGTPLYARTTEVAPIQTQLSDRLAVTTDLNQILMDQDFANSFTSNITTFYAPVEPSEGNCVYQPISTTHVVRRTRG